MQPETDMSSLFLFSSKQQICSLTMADWQGNWLIIESIKPTHNNDHKQTNLPDLSAYNFPLSLFKARFDVWEEMKRISEKQKSYLTAQKD